jgi:hypothetical protein
LSRCDVGEAAVARAAPDFPSRIAAVERGVATKLERRKAAEIERASVDGRAGRAWIDRLCPEAQW